jgi:hypothetical protein
MTKEMLAFAVSVIDWHKNKMSQFDLVINKKDASIVLGDVTLEAGTDLHRGVVIGFMLAKEQVKDLPFSLEEKEQPKD